MEKHNILALKRKCPTCRGKGHTKYRSELNGMVEMRCQLCSGTGYLDISIKVFENNVIVEESKYEKYCLQYVYMHLNLTGYNFIELVNSIAIHTSNDNFELDKSMETYYTKKTHNYLKSIYNVNKFNLDS